MDLLLADVVGDELHPLRVPVKVYIRLPGKGNAHSHGARPVHQLISIIKWIRRW